MPAMAVPKELHPRVLLAAYASGAFPMPDPEDETQLLWFSPDPRGIMPLGARFHVPRRLAQTIRRGSFACTIDRDFGGVMHACGRREEGTWISQDFLTAYGRLHELGFAHSVEAWPVDDAGLPIVDVASGPAGGAYGVALGGAFFAESMFHSQTDAGKVALVHLVEHLRGRGFLLCDVQWLTPNLTRFGAFEVSRPEYMELLMEAIAARARF
jgi:leucyl/phenylalanyl-tRNA--protein transferase